MTKPIRLACVEVCNFRRLSKTRLEFDETTTTLVGANNSGKTSILTVLRNFLSESPGFRPFDISLGQWAKLRELGLQWELLEQNPTIDVGDVELWEHHYKELLSCMPYIDLWFDAQEGAYSLVAPFITSLKWAGGAVGARVRLEPVVDIDGLRKLAWDYREARLPVKGLAKDGHAWPTDLLDFWLRSAMDLRRAVAYRLDPAKGPLVDKMRRDVQELPANALPIEMTLLRKILRVDFIPAQRGLGTEEGESKSSGAAVRPGLFSAQLLKFARQHLNVTPSGQGNREELVSAIAKAQSDLDKTIHDALKPAMEDVEVLGYPGLHDPQHIHFRTRIQTSDLLSDGTAVQYRLDNTAEDESLPEYSIGLGYQNLQSLSFMLVSFRTARLNDEKGPPAAVHLVMVEEPEAHLHVQVQRSFAKNAHSLICPRDPIHSNLCSQLLISTHSSHLAHGDSFTKLRYVKRIPGNGAGIKPSTEVINLGDVFGNDIETRIFAERYFQIQHTDLLFADGAIFVEGTAERMLVPLFINKYFANLASKYISFLDIGGSHAHRLKPLVERLGIPTVVITDIDPVVPAVSKKGRAVKKAAYIDNRKDIECGNDTLTGWHPRIEEFSAFAKPEEKDLVLTLESGLKVRFSWQLPVAAAENQWPSSFEDSLVLSNLNWIKQLINEEKEANRDIYKGTLGKVVGLVADYEDHKELLAQLHEMLHGSFDKGDFAATVFEKLNAGAPIICPEYIASALKWMTQQLTAPAVEEQ
ncbi:AAA family ATPase [Herbaspirillum sp. NPDC101396]|uniref:AAA family ATPase n=1 Tax=Herbaspirillum sp. NPDC101396 TaxID=3364005 RepID=UPI00383A7E8A